jgi:hypothetical protein
MAWLGCALSLLGFSGCKSQPIPVHDPGLQANPVRYLRYALRGETSGFYIEAWRSNLLSQPVMFRPGSKVEIRLYSQDRIDLYADGTECVIRYRDMPFPTNPEGLRQTVEKYFAVTKEELNLESAPPEIRKQIDEGQVAIGMTKEQVFAALGYPSHLDNHVPADSQPRDRILESNTWIYRASEVRFLLTWWTTYWEYKFDPEGKLVQVVR